MQIFNSTSIARAEAIRLFHIIQQSNHVPTQILERESLREFILFQGMNPSADIVSIMHHLDKEGKEMNKDYWGQCISASLVAQQIRTEVDMGTIHQKIKDLLIGVYERPLTRFQQWDENWESSQNEREQKLIMIFDIEKGSLYMGDMDANSFGASLQKINYCLSIVTLGLAPRAQIERIYQSIFKGNFKQVLRYCLSINSSPQMLINLLKCLCYLFTALKYESIKKIIKQTFLCESETLRGLLQNMGDQRVQIKYYTFVLICLATFHLPQFSDVIIRDEGCLAYISNNIQILSEDSGIIFGLQILVNLVEAFLRQDLVWQHSQKSIVESIFIFGMQVLKNGNNQKIDTQQTCLKLLGACVKYERLSEQSLQALNILNNVFQVQESSFQNNRIVSGVLNIIRNLLIYRRFDIKSTLINDKNFESYFHQSLTIYSSEEFQHANILHIVNILSRPQYAKYLFEKQLITPIFDLSSSRNGCIKFILSEILINLLRSALLSQWMLAFMYQRKILDCIGTLLRQSFCDDEILTFHYGKQNQIFCFHRQVFINCMRVLYALTDDRQTQGASFLKKCQFYKKGFSQQFIDNFSKAIQLLFITYRRHDNYLQFMLLERHEVSLQHNKKIKLYKLISLVIEEMTINLRKRYVSEQVLKKVHVMRTKFLESLYATLKINELQAQNIPIYIKLEVIVENERTLPQRVYRLSWNHLQSYLHKKIKQMYESEPQKFKIENAVQKNELKSEYDYRRLLDYITSDYEKSNFEIKIRVFNIITKKDLPDYRSSSMNFNDSPSRNMSSYEPSRFMSMRIPQERYPSPIASNRNMRGQHYSPTFGKQCRKCGKITRNNDRICDDCFRP